MAARDDALIAAPHTAFGKLRAPSLALAAAAALFLLPCLQSLIEGSWTTEAGALGPLVLAAGTATLWLRWRESREFSRPGLLWLALMLLGLAGMIYVAARAINMASLLCASGWLATVAVLYGCYGGRVIRRCWFPLGFLLIAIPLPYALTVEATALLRSTLADAATVIAAGQGLEVAVNGYAVFVDQYELAIESACAGLSSTASLLAVGLLYAYWVRAAGWPRIVLIALAAFPVAITANLLRIVALLWLVHFGGMRALDTFLHPLSGFISFAIALALLLLADAGAIRMLPNGSRT